MSGLVKTQRTAFYAPTAKRSYLTKRSAAHAEARAMMRNKYPTEKQESDNIGITYRGWHWMEDERLCKVAARLARIIMGKE